MLDNKLTEHGTRAAVANVEKFSARNIANTLWALAKMMHHPGGTFLNSLGAEAGKKVTDFNAQNHANTVWAFATLGKLLLHSKPCIANIWDVHIPFAEAVLTTAVSVCCTYCLYRSHDHAHCSYTVAVRLCKHAHALDMHAALKLAASNC